jgi:hypothetical protein
MPDGRSSRTRMARGDGAPAAVTRPWQRDDHTHGRTTRAWAAREGGRGRVRPAAGWPIRRPRRLPALTPGRAGSGSGYGETSMESYGEVGPVAMRWMVTEGHQSYTPRVVTHQPQFET